ncbi:MAG: MFS transporter [Lentihominibacter sp.]
MTDRIEDTTLVNTNTKKTRRAAIIVVLLTAFTMSLTGSAMNLSIPMIGEEFDINASTVGWMVTGYMLTIAALSVPFGRLSDLTCRKTVLVTGGCIFIGGCVMSVFAFAFPVLLASRIVQGIGGAMVLSCNVPILISTYPPAMRGKALGLAVGGVYAGLSLGPVIGGVLTHNLGWRWIFVFAGILTVAAVVTAIPGIPREKSQHRDGARMDYRGSSLFVVFIVMFMLGLSKIEAGPIPVMTALAGLVMGAVFVVYASKAPEPILNVHLFRENIGYALSNVSAMLNYAATFAIGYLTSIYLQVVMGYSSQTAGLILIAQPVVMAVLTPTMGRLSDRYSPFRLSSGGMAFCGAGTLMFVFVSAETSLPYIIAALMITGLGMALFSSPNTNAILSCVEKKDYGAANSVVNTMRSIGQTLSMVIVTVIVTIMLPGMQLEAAGKENLVSVMNASFIVFAAMCFAGVFLSLKRKKG